MHGHLGLLRWRLEHLEATIPSRLGRGGLKLGRKAPGFSLPSVQGGARALADFAGRKVLLGFVKTGCTPCRGIAPALNELQRGGQVQVLVVHRGDLEAARQWAAEARACFPVLAQEDLALSQQYQVFATPFAFFIDEQGVITSKGIMNDGQQLGFVLSGARATATRGQLGGEAEQSKADTFVS
jgi:peroxiredoxin